MATKRARSLGKPKNGWDNCPSGALTTLGQFLGLLEHYSAQLVCKAWRVTWTAALAWSPNVDFRGRDICTPESTSRELDAIGFDHKRLSGTLGNQGWMPI